MYAGIVPIGFILKALFRVFYALVGKGLFCSKYLLPDNNNKGIGRQSLLFLFSVKIYCIY
jgi:hypothetical protein